MVDPPMPTLKFSKGGYLVNDKVTDIQNIKLIADMSTLRIGWVRYDSGFAVKEIMGKVSENFQPPPREELGDFDESEWEKEGEGRFAVPRDPWHETYDVVVHSLDNLNDCFLLVFDSSDCGGHIDWECYWGNDICVMQSLGILCQVYAAHARRARDELPIIELTSRVMFTHSEHGVLSRHGVTG
jgi:hypothetical protein